MLDREIPFFGICFGNQILGRALGSDTYKLRYGHRGMNQPVMDRRTGKVEITAQNHGFAVQAPLEGTFDTSYGPALRSATSTSTTTCVEGLRSDSDRPAYSVQYHPEAAADRPDG